MNPVNFARMRRLICVILLFTDAIKQFLPAILSITVCRYHCTDLYNRCRITLAVLRVYGLVVSWRHHVRITSYEVEEKQLL